MKLANPITGKEFLCQMQPVLFVDQGNLLTYEKSFTALTNGHANTDLTNWNKKEWGKSQTTCIDAENQTITLGINSGST